MFDAYFLFLSPILADGLNVVVIVFGNLFWLLLQAVGHLFEFPLEVYSI